MNNHLSVLTATAGLFAALFGAFGLDVALTVAGSVLFLAATVLLIEFPGGDR